MNSINALNPEIVKEKISQLIEKYEKEKSAGKISQYTEAETKNGFIEPLFQALGWDTQNRDEVGLETSVSGGRVDYSFKISGITKFFCRSKTVPCRFRQSAIYSTNNKLCLAQRRCLDSPYRF